MAAFNPSAFNPSSSSSTTSVENLLRSFENFSINNDYNDISQERQRSHYSMYDRADLARIQARREQDEYLLRASHNFSPIGGFQPRSTVSVSENQYGGNLSSNNYQDHNMYGAATTGRSHQYSSPASSSSTRPRPRPRENDERRVPSHIFEATFDRIFGMIADEHGHYIFIKVVRSCNIAQLKRIVSKVIPQNGLNIVASANRFGLKSANELIKVLADNTYALMTQQETVGIVGFCLANLDNQLKEPLCQALKFHGLPLAIHGIGCRYLQKCFDYMTNPYRDSLLRDISIHSPYLSRDPYGNYVVQSVLKLKELFFTEMICYNLKDNYVSLSLHKVGSHVVEECLRSTGMRYAIKDLTNSDQLVQVARNEFGNYVIQKALLITQYVHIESHLSLLEALQPHMRSLKHHTNGRNVYKLIERLSLF